MLSANVSDVCTSSHTHNRKRARGGGSDASDGASCAFSPDQRPSDHEEADASSGAVWYAWSVRANCTESAWAMRAMSTESA